MDCVPKASSSILINGRKSTTFNHSRGLRQGDPMSPYLFNICLQAFSADNTQACTNKDWAPFLVGAKRVPISHLLFADDLILFGRVDEKTAYAVRDTLDLFCSVSGQKINEEKSRLTFSPNTTQETKDLFQDTLNVRESENLGMYLGIPISHKKPNRKDVQFIVDKVRSRLANWKAKFLSRAVDCA